MLFGSKKDKKMTVHGKTARIVGALFLSIRRLLAAVWPWIFGISAINGAFLVVGSVILVYLFRLNNPDLFLWSFYFAVVSLLVTVFAGVAYDVQRQVGGESSVDGGNWRIERRGA